MVLNLYPAFVHENDLSPEAVGTDIDEVCNQIKEAIDGWGTDEGALITALGPQDAESRCKIALRYPELHGSSLKDVLKSECGNKSFGTVLQLLASPSHEAECDMITKACKGLGTDEMVLYPIICGRSNEEINILKAKYFDLTGNDLGRVLDGELGGDLEKLIFNCLQGVLEDYDPEYHTEELEDQDVESIYEAGQGSFGTDEAGFFKIIAARPAEHLEKVSLKYADKYGYTLWKALDEELTGQVRDASMFMMGMKLKPERTAAKLIRDSCIGFGTNELLLTCAVIRYQPIMQGVMEAHAELYEMSLEDRIKEDVGGDYEKILLALIGITE